MIEIPLTSNGEQLLSITLDGVIYDLKIMYNTRVNIWSMDISSLDVQIVTGVTLVIGVDILSAYNIDLKGMYVINVVNANVDATADNLGTDVKLFKLTSEELEDVSTI